MVTSAPRRREYRAACLGAGGHRGIEAVPVSSGAASPTVGHEQSDERERRSKRRNGGERDTRWKEWDIPGTPMTLPSARPLQRALKPAKSVETIRARRLTGRSKRRTATITDTGAKSAPPNTATTRMVARAMWHTPATLPKKPNRITCYRHVASIGCRALRVKRGAGRPTVGFPVDPVGSPESEHRARSPTQRKRRRRETPACVFIAVRSLADTGPVPVRACQRAAGCQRDALASLCQRRTCWRGFRLAAPR